MKVIANPLVGMPGNLFMMEGGVFPGIVRAFVNHEYVKAMEMVVEYR